MSIKNKIPKEDGNEMLPVMNEEGKIVGLAPRRACHDGSRRLIHPVVHLHVINCENKILLQKRANWKETQPGKWDTAVGGHVRFGESIEEALLRETREEIGFAMTVSPVSLARYLYESDTEREMVYSFLIELRDNGEALRPGSDEVSQLRFWTADEACRDMGKQIFTPNLEQELNDFLLSTDHGVNTFGRE